MLGLLITLVIVGLVAGALARLLVPGKDSMSIGLAARLSSPKPSRPRPGESQGGTSDVCLSIAGIPVLDREGCL